MSTLNQRQGNQEITEDEKFANSLKKLKRNYPKTNNKLKWHLFVSLFLVPFSFSCPYLIAVSYNLTIFSTPWNIGDLYVLYGGMLTFLGTVLLSVLALYQNYKLDIQNSQTQEALKDEMKCFVEKLQRENQELTEQLHGDKKSFEKSISDLSIEAQNKLADVFQQYKTDTNNYSVELLKLLEQYKTDSNYFSDELLKIRRNSENKTKYLDFMQFIMFTNDLINPITIMANQNKLTADELNAYILLMADSYKLEEEKILFYSQTVASNNYIQKVRQINSENVVLVAKLSKLNPNNKQGNNVRTIENMLKFYWQNEATSFHTVRKSLMDELKNNLSNENSL